MYRKDLYANHAAVLFGVPVAEVTDDQRQAARDFVCCRLTTYAQRIFSRLAYAPEDELASIERKLDENSCLYAVDDSEAEDS